MTDRKGVTMEAVAISGTVAIPFNSGRTYLALVCTADTTVTIISGEPFVVSAASVWSPMPAPINDISFTGAATRVTG